VPHPSPFLRRVGVFGFGLSAVGAAQVSPVRKHWVPDDAQRFPLAAHFPRAFAPRLKFEIHSKGSGPRLCAHPQKPTLNFEATYPSGIILTEANFSCGNHEYAMGGPRRPRCHVLPISLALPQGCHSDSPLSRQNPVSTRRSTAGRRELSASRRIPSGTTLLSDSGISGPEPEKISH
jgi:hypothetical protein